MPLDPTFWHHCLRHLRRPVAAASVPEILQRVEQNGCLSASFVFLAVTSCGIATLGLLLNSVAVIIGAMLIAPLMNPIMLAGFAIARLDPLLVGRAALALLVGVLAALLLSIALVRLAPFIPPTSEILARTQPNLFDLLVAILSGLAGGYAIVRQQGGVVVGVAIATALMPPLATVGYGIATADASIAQGALFLFITNLLAIALAVAAMAAWYGFGVGHPQQHWGRLALASTLLLALSVPLGQRLNQSAQDTWRAKRIEDAIRADPALTKGRIAQLDIQVQNGVTQVDLILLTHQFDPLLENRLQQAVQQRQAAPVTLRVDQLLSAQAAKASAKVTPDAAMSALPFGVQRVSIDARRKTAVALAGAGELLVMMQQEQQLQARFKDWQIHIIPPVQPLAIRFPPRSASLDDTARNQLEAIAWCFRRWGTKTITAEGWEASDEVQRRGEALSTLRAAGVATWLSHQGFGVEALNRMPDQAQRAAEKETGMATYRLVVLRAADHPQAIAPVRQP